MSAHATTTEAPASDPPTAPRAWPASTPSGTLRSDGRSSPPPGHTAGSPIGRHATALATLAVAGLLCLGTFLAGGGLKLASMTTLELTLTLLGGAIVAAAVVLLPAGARTYGAWPIALLLAFTALTGLSIAWSVAPDASWQDAGRMLSYSAVFAAAVALAWIAPGGWRALLGGIVLAAGVVCTYALLTKVLPDRLDAADTYARLQQPYGYWNSIGLTAGMGAIGCLWLGARRSGHALLSALAYPAIGLMLVTVMLAYSRGALAALAIGVIAWMALVPLRLRGVRVLAVGAIAAAPVVAWNFSKSALKDEAVGLAARTTAGHQFGVLLAAMLLLLLLAGAAIGFFGDRRAGWAGSKSGTRTAAGFAIAALLALAIAGAFGALAMSSRGLTGTISHDLSSLTDPNARVPNTSARLTAASSVRARYWKEAFDIFEAHPALGAGAAGYETARLRYRTVPIDVRQAHGYIVQTLADLGIVGLALTLALFFTWGAATGRSTHPFNRRWSARQWSDRGRSQASVFGLRPPSLAWRSEPRAYTPERIGLLSMLCIVVTFGVHSFVDWTWYVPGDALVALLCAGWLAGRGPLPQGNLLAPAGSPQAAAGAPSASSNGLTSSRAASRVADTASDANSDANSGANSAAGTHADPSAGWSPHRLAGVEPTRIAIAALVVAGALLAAWTEWQPQRSVDASEQALALLRRNPVAALSAAQAAVQRDPLSATALFRMAAVQHETGQKALARSTLQKAVRMQPSNPETWSTLGEYDLHADPNAAVRELRAAVYLDPQSVALMNVYVEALRAAGPSAIAKAEAESTSAAPRPRGATNSRATNSSRARTRTPAQNRERRALASSTARAPGMPPAPRSSTSSKR